jgi:hypothetical protein
MAESRTVPSAESVDAFIRKVADEGRRADALCLREMMERVSGEPAVLWGSSIVGFGAYRYRYASGRTGSMARIGFSPRAKEIVVYLMDGFPEHQDLLERLGRHRTGKACLYIRRLSDIDRDVLEELVSASLLHMRERYPDGA